LQEDEMIASVEWKPGTSQYVGHSESGHSSPYDVDAPYADGPSPVESVLAALCACTSVDVVNILRKKREPLTGLTVSAVAERAPEPPKVFTHILLTYKISGNVARKAAEDAVLLSKNKYCSVSKMLEQSARIDFEIEFVDAAVTA
jgi:putative redox protein